MIALFFAGIALASLSNDVFAAPRPDADLAPAEQVMLLCDADKGRLHIRALGDHDDADATYPARTLIQVADFFGLSSGQYRLYKKRSYQCGAYRVEFSGDALNSNIQGELGAEPAFLSVSIYHDHTSILAPTRLVTCQSGDPSSRRGQCPADYATRLDIRHAAGQSHISVSAVQIADELDAEFVTTVRSSVVPDRSLPGEIACAKSPNGTCKPS